ncbi:hypothetical protein B9086_008860 [Morganella morganii subsp. morganii]|uniref:hypothetical protein n=1 Tax=Morganella morganii TaxID=582 RepID=UPI000B4188A3|nr:hypothetical protein [Morganella morganii]RDC69511.1 hypothetical protein DVJ80_07355 [Morganella morganii]RNW12879.1 hypothetical protein B9086_008860 [Morganella morganii subsp. morganii]HBC7441234.1 hypothetical protein [Morganella morganii]HBC7444583.1 hypothetical protein [Morganella morganii]
MKYTDFIISKEIIDITIKKNEEYLNNNQVHWCNHSSTQPSSANYNDSIYQSIYTIRYFPAYYAEYCMLSHCFYMYITSREVKSLNFISLGCGAATDYYALKDNLHDITFNYKGLDFTRWNDSLFPDKGNNFSHIKKSISEVNSYDINDIDAIIFPKSISNLDIDNALTNLANLLSSTSKKSYYVLTSRENYRYPTSYEKFHNKMIENGFSILTIFQPKDDIIEPQTHMTTWYYTGDNFYEASNNFNVKAIQCSIKTFKPKKQCEDCKVIYHPITKINNDMMGFNFFIYRKD